MLIVAVAEEPEKEKVKKELVNGFKSKNRQIY